MVRLRTTVTAVLTGLALLLAGASAQSAAAGTRSSPAAASGSGSPAPTAGLVDIGGGRTIWLECRGSGSPTVLLVSGAAGAHDDWTYVMDGSDPAAAPRPSASAVFSEVSRFTRVCVYDRPGTSRFTGELSPSTPVPQPTTAQAGVSDLGALLAASGEPGPYVLVGASWGGMLINLFARNNSADVSGLVFVDGASDFLKESLTPAQWAAWMQAVDMSAVSPGGEVPDYEAAVAEIRAATALPTVPAAVLTADRPWNLPLGDLPPSWPAWTAAQDRLADSLHATHITDTDSGHAINVENPRVVVDAVRGVVDAARRTPGRPTTTR
jgi:pimeloyl-ACP methyl ester carboxylesterase